MADPLRALRAAYAARDPRADELRRELARGFARAPEAPAPYYELLCLVAEQAWHRGEPCRAEALLRRALRIAETLDRDPRGAAQRLAAWIAESMCCDLELARASPPSCTVIEADFACSLMRLDLATLDHVPMMSLDDRWLLVTPIASGGGKLAARCAVLLDGIMAHHNRGLAAGTPSDPSFIGVRRVAARLVGSAEVHEVAAGLRRSPWSPSPLYVVDGRRFAPMTLPQFFDLVAN